MWAQFMQYMRSNIVMAYNTSIIKHLLKCVCVHCAHIRVISIQKNMCVLSPVLHVSINIKNTLLHHHRLYIIELITYLHTFFMLGIRHKYFIVIIIIL